MLLQHLTPVATFFTILFILNLLPTFEHLFSDTLQLKSLAGFLILGICGWVAFNQPNRLWLIAFFTFGLASFAGLPTTAQKPLHKLLDLQGQSALCKWISDGGNVRLYKVRHIKSGLEIIMRTGQNAHHEPLVCAYTPSLLPIFAPYTYNPVEGIDLNSPHAAEKLMERSRNKVLTGRITLLFIPSLRAQALDVPFQAQNKFFALETGRFPRYGVEVTELPR